ncbi:glycosyltransferase family 4 protein [Candidatus Micrarchaeota archaeon]|nr:glycosyltransferase family 4 protein [Candidatus Micrarchaeota archaeon]
MRLLMLNPFYYPYSGGTEKHLFEACRRLAKKHDVTVLTSMLPHTKREEEIEGVRILRTPAAVLTWLPHPLPPPVPLYPLPWPDFVREVNDADVVHIHNRFVYSLFELFAIKKILKKKLALTLHNAKPQGIDLPTDFVGGLYEDVYGRKIMANCDAIAGVSKNTLDITVPPDLLMPKQVVYNGVDVDWFNPKNSGGTVLRDLVGVEGKKIVLTVCRLVEQKGLDYLLESIPLVDKQMNGKAHFVLVGRGPLLSHLQKKARSLGVEGKISFLAERFSEKDLAALYAACDCFVLPSLWEPFGIVVVEAMATGKPVVGTDIGGIPEIIAHGKNGFLVQPRDARALAERIAFVLENPKAAKKMGAEGRKIAVKNFTWDETAKSYEQFYAKF